jgi:hypothetical protein
VEVDVCKPIDGFGVAWANVFGAFAYATQLCLAL